MKYLYYPGCSLEGTALEYNVATQAFMAALGAELEELNDWTCCGASAAESTSHLLSLVLPARNLALADKMNDTADILVPCSACYLNLKKVEEKIRREPQLLDQINTILAEDNLVLQAKVRVRHLLDVISRDLGPQAIRRQVRRSLAGISVAPYYGCQCLRPYAVFDDPEAPRSMEAVITAAGAGIHPWKMGGKCCGASLMNTKPQVGLEHATALLAGAKGADVIATVCPMCQMNLEAYQDKVCRHRHKDLRVSIVYLPQLLGLAIGLSEEAVRLDLNLAVTDRFKQKLKQSDLVAAMSL